MVYSEKFKQILPQTVFHLLPEPEKVFLSTQAEALRFTQQELRIICEMALDRTRWKESSLESTWTQLASSIPNSNDRNQKKKRILASLSTQHDALKSRENNYQSWSKKDKPKTEKPIIKTTVKTDLGLGRCPVASVKTRCCNLMTLDAVEKCGFDCSYCSIQSFYHGNQVVFDQDFAKKLDKLQLDPDKTYHIGTGQSSDSLMWGNHNGVLDALCHFARRHPNVILELKTKSRNIGWLLENDIPKNIICTWSLNPQTIIDHEEHLSASLKQRLDCAKQLAEKDCIVGFHFHPIIRYQGWKEDYVDITQTLCDEFDPDSVALVSLGTLTYTKSVMKTIRQRNLNSKILQMPMEEIAGKYSYPLAMKLEMFQAVYQGLARWHDMVFFYLCMEDQSLWQPVFGYQYNSNIEFESAMKSAYFHKINKKLTS